MPGRLGGTLPAPVTAGARAEVGAGVAAHVGTADGASIGGLGASSIEVQMSGGDDEGIRDDGDPPPEHEASTTEGPEEAEQQSGSGPWRHGVSGPTGGTRGFLRGTAGEWRPASEWADIDHTGLRDSLRTQYRSMGLESGRHDQFPRAMERELLRMADEADRSGVLAEYGERLREIAATYARRASSSGHRGGR